MLHASNSGEEVVDGRWVLKGGTATVLWNAIAKHVEVDCMHEEANG